MGGMHPNIIFIYVIVILREYGQYKWPKHVAEDKRMHTVKSLVFFRIKEAYIH
jgi:hypothetical protein